MLLKKLTPQHALPLLPKPAAAAAAATAAAVVDSWLLDRLLLLHHLGVAQQLRSAFEQLQAIDGAAASVQELNTRWLLLILIFLVLIFLIKINKSF
jgi:hypothetical protein